MYKCEQSGYDLDLALLALRSTPLDSHSPSPAELLNGRKFRTTIPAINQNIPTNTEVKEHFENRQEVSKGYYDRHARSKEELTQNQTVRVYNNDSRRWEPAIITDFAETPRSYIVQRGAGGRRLRRNRQHIKPTQESWQNGVPPDPLDKFDQVVEEDDGPHDDSHPGVTNPTASPGAVQQDEAPEQPMGLEGSCNGGRRYPERVRCKPARYR